jgi:hypothetical protein
MAPQHPLHRALEIIVAPQSKDSAEIMKRLFVSLEKGLLRRVMISPMEGRATHHAAQREYLCLQR